MYFENVFLSSMLNNSFEINNSLINTKNGKSLLKYVFLEIKQIIL